MTKVKKKLGSKVALPIMVLTAVLGLLSIAAPVQAITHLGIFELDGNAIDDQHIATIDDWSDLFGTLIPPNHPDNAKAKEFVPDSLIPDQIFTQGSKDTNNINTWRWTNGTVPDKNEIADAYAGAYSNNGSLILYYGDDRFAFNGDNNVGFWFFKNQITLNPNGTFNGIHADGDLFVFSQFTQGGSISSIQVYKWNASIGTTQLLRSFAACPPGFAPNNTSVCAIVNTVDTPSPWNYTPKFGTQNIFPVATFFEGTLNVSDLIPDAGCFSSFMANTRASQSFGAELKDFALGDFNLCRVAVNKTGDTISKAGDDVTYNFNITNTGVVTLYLQSVIDTLLNGLTGTASAAGCGILAPDASCSFTASRTVQPTDPDPLPNTVTVDYRGTASLTGTAVTASDSHSVDLVHPNITVTKTANNTISKAGDALTYTITVTNTGDVDLNTNSVSDSLLGDISASFGAALAAGASETKTFDYIVKASDPDPLNNTVTVHYSVTSLPNDVTAQASATVDLVHPDMTLTKTANPTSGSVGTVITYTMVITNTGDVQLNRVSVIDTLMGDISSDFPATLAPSESATVTKTRAIQVGDTSPVNNTVTAIYQVNDLTNQLTREASASVTIPNEGCTPGFWKNHPSLWDQPTDAVSANLSNAVTAAGYGPSNGTTSALFKDTFGLTDAQMSAAGLDSNLTLLQAINLGGGGFEKLARHGVAGALSAASGINYPYTTTQVLTMVHDAVVTLTPEPTATNLANANNLQCPLG